MKEAIPSLGRAIELVLTTGLSLSALLLILGLTTGWGALLGAGVLLLMMTPVARVVVLTAGLLLRRDWIFGLMSLWVLGVLLASMFWAWRA